MGSGRQARAVCLKRHYRWKYSLHFVCVFLAAQCEFIIVGIALENVVVIIFCSIIPFFLMMRTANRANHRVAQENQDRFNVEHGGLTPNVTNAIFTFQRDDPSRSLSVTQDLSESAVAIMVLGKFSGTFSYNSLYRLLNRCCFFFVNVDPSVFYKTDTYASQEMIDVKNHIMAIIRSWSRTMK